MAVAEASKVLHRSNSCLNAESRSFSRGDNSEG